MQLPLSSLTVNIKQSRDYVRLGLVIHALVLLAMYETHPAWPNLFCVAVLLSWPLAHILRYQTPYTEVMTLSYHRPDWLLTTARGQQAKYEGIQVLLDTGFFMLIKLTAKQQQRTLVLFHDQLTVYEARMLHVLEKLQ